MAGLFNFEQQPYNINTLQAPENSILKQPPQELFSNNFQQEKPPTPKYMNAPLDYVTAQTQNTLLNLKDAWNTVEQNINFNNNLLASGKLNDSYKEAAQAENALLKAQQGEYAKMADMTRNTAHNLGIDTSGFNADNTLAESQQAIQLRTAQEMQGLLNLKPVQAQQLDAYNQMREAGLSPRRARRTAALLHDEFRENNVNQLLNGLQNYGYDPDGSINQFGTMLLGKLTNENPYITQTLMNLVATPKNAYSEAQQNYRQGLVADRQDRMQEQNFRNDLFKLNAMQDFQREQNEQAQANAERMAILNAALKGTGVAQDKLTQEIQGLMRMGLDEETAKNLYLRQHYSNALKSLNPDSGILKDENEFSNFADGYFGSIETFINLGNNEAAKQMIEELQSQMASGEFKYATSLNAARANYILTRLDRLSKVANGEMTLEQLEKLEKGAKNGHWQESNYDEKAINEAKRIAEEDRKKREQERQAREKYEHGRDALTSTQPINFTGQSILRNPNPENVWERGYSGNGGIYGYQISFNPQN
ncbi:MAG: hypothetical protein IJT73_07400 [Selenomonadaceae bacterium]|nr:hypothetical protein [Selenomonadaceae bacterium]